MTEREISYRILISIFTDKELSHIALGKALKECDEKGYNVNKAFITNLVNGVCERYLTLMYLICKQSGRTEEKIKQQVKIMLAMGAYQIYYMSVPASAACNETVKLAEKHKMAGLKGFINGVLRGLLRNVEDVDGFLNGELAEKSTAERFSAAYSCPERLVKYFIGEYGESETERMLKASFAKKSITVYRLSKVSDIEFKRAFEEDGIEIREIKGIRNAYEICTQCSLSSLTAYKKGWFIVQDVSSMLATELLPEIADCKILDLCAAPGGKAIHCADRFLDTGCDVTARDLTDGKVRLIKETALRLNVKNIRCEASDALINRPEDAEAFGLVVADLPCSGLGVIGKKPDIKYKTSPEDIKALASLQKKILKNAAAYVKPGGCLAYSTCTVSHEENTENADFIEKCGLKPEPLKNVPEDYEKYLLSESRMLILPDGKHDGFFIALFRKTI